MTGREERKTKIENKINKTLEGKSRIYADYVASCFSEGQQPTSVKLYLETVLAFMRRTNNECTEESIKKIRPMDITNYLNEIRTKKLKDGTIVPTSTSYRATTFSALRSFFDFLKTNKMIDDNPMSNIKRPKVTDQKPDQHLTIGEMKTVLEMVKEGCTNTQKSKTHERHLKTRNEAIIKMLLELGIRCSALMCLDVDNVDLENKKIVYKDKGEKAFEKPLSNELIQSLKVWLSDRSKMEPKTRALFVSEKKNRCSYSAILQVVKRYTKAATGNAMSVHKMRHSAITAVHELNGGDIMHTSKFAGHGNVVITQRYIHEDYSGKDMEISGALGAIMAG